MPASQVRNEITEIQLAFDDCESALAKAREALALAEDRHLAERSTQAKILVSELEN